jgi:hypothetical protein
MPLIFAPVMELVDMRDLGSRAEMRVGSSPFRRTIAADVVSFAAAFYKAQIFKNYDKILYGILHVFIKCAIFDTWEIC